MRDGVAASDYLPGRDEHRAVSAQLPGTGKDRDVANPEGPCGRRRDGKFVPRTEAREHAAAADAKVQHARPPDGLGSEVASKRSGAIVAY